MREFKFRAWDYSNCVMEYNVNVDKGKPVKYGYQWYNPGNTILDSDLMQYTGLKDKNGYGCNEVYEGDIITVDGKIRGNIYEIEPRETDIVIPPIGTKAWNSTYKKAVERGFDYSE